MRCYFKNGLYLALYVIRFIAFARHRLPKDIVNGDKIYFQRMRKISLFPRIVACYDNNDLHGLYTCSVITKKLGDSYSLKSVLCIINSKLINIWYKFL